LTITAKVILHSISPEREKIATLQLRYPKFIHAEFMTHRDFSRNASSSRAIPVERLIQDIIRDPAMPVYWGKNQTGMQARQELNAVEQVAAENAWRHARDYAIMQARELIKLGVHKQIANRVLEPFSHINVVVTSTKWANFFALRRHADAQPEIKALADAMWEALEASIPQFVGYGGWHLPYVDEGIIDPDMAIKLSVARCARVSYLTHEGKKPNINDDLALYDRLVGSVPLHASPAEHQATPEVMGRRKGNSNFHGWTQYRKLLPEEYVHDR